MHERRGANPRPLAGRPLIVIGAGRRPPPPGMTPEAWEPLRRTPQGGCGDKAPTGPARQSGSMDMLGIEDYHPTYFHDAAAFAAAEGPMLRSLIGQVIRNAWSMWSAAGDEWFPDGPVILRVGEHKQVELSAYQLGFGITWRAIDRSKPLRWYVEPGEEDGFQLYWKAQAPEPLRLAVGRCIEGVELWECNAGAVAGPGQWFLWGVGLPMEGGYLMAHNALDELGLSLKRPEEGTGLRVSRL